MAHRRHGSVLRMRPVLIGAGRGSRLEHRTDEIPKTLVPVMGRPMLEWILEALGEAGFTRKRRRLRLRLQGRRPPRALPRVHVRREHATGRTTTSSSRSSTRASYLGGGFVSSYTDIVYRGSAVKDVVAATDDKVLVCDTDWRRRYVRRTKHPETDAEKMRAEGDARRRALAHDRERGRVGRVHRRREVHRATARASCSRPTTRRRRTCETLGDRPFQKAYLIHLWQWMIERGSTFHRVDTHGGYMELDTLEDLSLAETWWQGGS